MDITSLKKVLINLVLILWYLLYVTAMLFALRIAVFAVMTGH